MNILLLSHEWLVLLLALALVLADLWLPASQKAKLGCFAAAGLGGILIYSFVAVRLPPSGVEYAFSDMYLLDPFALFFKRFFLVAGIIVLIMSVGFFSASGGVSSSDANAAGAASPAAPTVAPASTSGIAEFYTIALFALTGMLFSASVNHFALLFVSLELITVSFYILTSFQRSRLISLEAGVKYLIIGALSTGFTVFGIALLTGVTGQMSFDGLAGVAAEFAENKIFLAGLALLMVGLGFKISAFPFQMWAPDVYQGAPSPTTAFLAVGSKAAGFALLLRVLFTAVPDVTVQHPAFLIFISAVTIIYGNLGALPQRGVKRLMGYSSIAQAGYLLLGIAALSGTGNAAVLYYLGGYLFTVLAAFMVIAVVIRQAESDDVSALAGLNQRSPLLAAAMAMAMVSLAGIPPLAGFFGKFLLIKAAFAQGNAFSGYYWLVGIAIAGVVISLYYYFNVIRAIYWSKDAQDLSPITPSLPVRATLYACIAAMLFIGIYPNPLLKAAEEAVSWLR